MTIALFVWKDNNHKKNILISEKYTKAQLLLSKNEKEADTYIYGIGDKFSNQICSSLEIPRAKRINELTDDEILKIREYIDQNFKVEGDLRRDYSLSIKRLIDLACYRGTRHRKKLPVRGQRTRCNARTRKGKAIAIAGKKLTPTKK